jgi:riboflavin transporter FmnP
MKISTKTITRVAIFGAISALLYCFVKFPLPIFLPFYEIKICDVPALIGGFSFGPLAGCLIQVVKIIVKLVFVGSNTAFVGEFSDLMSGIVMVLPASLYYKYHRNLKGAIIGSLISAGTNVIFSAIMNYAVLLPFYGELYLGGVDKLIGMIIGFYPSLNLTVENALWMCILICTIPFNLVKNILVVAVTFILYKRLGSFIKYIEKKAKIDNSYVEANPYSIISIISFIIVVFAFIGSVIRFINKDAVIGFILLAVAVVFITIGILVNKLKEKRKLEN